MVSNWFRQKAHKTKGMGALRLTMMTTNSNSYKMHNPGSAESHPSVLRGDRILICVNGSGFISKVEGMMYCACLDKTINLRKAGLCADGFSSKVNKANVVIWTADLIGHDKADHNKAKRMEAIAKKIRHSRMEMDMTQNGMIVDGFKECENVLYRPSKSLTHTIEVRNELDNNVLCTIKAIKGDVATKQGVIIGRDVQFVH
jgi:hypothetical protein